MILCAFGSFIFGWHVHEKAILMILIPLSFISSSDRIANQYFLLSLSGTYSLFPLLFKNQEEITKVALLAVYSIFMVESLPIKLHRFEKLYAAGFIVLHVYTKVHLLLFDMEFLPLMLTSTYCSLGAIYSFLNLYVEYMTFKD